MIMCMDKYSCLISIFERSVGKVKSLFIAFFIIVNINHEIYGVTLELIRS
jgi:hypothetical protein